ncbi:helix-turn-helix domain-containing protein [Enterococcus olivae]
MFGLDASTWTKQQVLYILEDRSDFISVQKLMELLNASSVESIKRLCRELQKDIAHCYPQGEIELSINRARGIKLKHQSLSQLQPVFDYLFSHDLAYTIYCSVLLREELSTIDFCKKHFISVSELKEKTKELNTHLNPYDLHISLLENIQIQGTEAKIRSFAFVFLFVVHRQFSKIPWLFQKDNTLQIIDAIGQYLKLELLEAQREILAIFFSVNQSPIEKEEHIYFFPYQKKFFRQLSFPEKPAFLPDWTKKDWEFFLLVIFTDDFSRFYLPIQTEHFHSTLIDAETKLWIDLFEKHFTIFDQRFAVFLKEKAVKKYLSTLIFPVNKLMAEVFPVVDLNYLTDAYPHYMNHFAHFWQEFSQRNTVLADDSFKINSLLLCFSLLPPQDFLPKRKIYFYTDLTDLYFNYIKNRLQLFFSNQYELLFVEEIQEADLIISTIDFLEIEDYAPQSFVRINVQLTNDDLDKIDQIIKKQFPSTSFHLI